ncbi:unnamed protein product [Adineta steineri]|uniref:BAG domain-containing protein n=1 Tax=Adineta steineri TaxID=433720 RepID=A0A815BDA9_9BILA|nr:unnamed protein product [Adineta steineri]
MSSSNTSGRPAGCVTIPVQIISSPDSNSYSRYSTYHRPNYTETSFNDFSNSPPYTKPTMNPYSTSRFQRRNSPIPAYDRLIQNSLFNEPCYDRPSYQEPQYYHSQQRIYEPRSLHTSRSSEDLLSSPPTDSTRSNNQSRNTTYYSPIFNSGFQSDSDFIEPNKYNTNSIRRSYDALNDSPDGEKKFPINRPYPSEQQQSYYRPSFVNSNEYRVPINQQQTNPTQRIINNSENKSISFPLFSLLSQDLKPHDRSHSPLSQRDESPGRHPPPPTSQQQQQQESDFKMTKDSTNNSNSKSETTATSLPTNDQQVPSTETIPIRDPNVIALEKLEQIKQNLMDLNQQVDAFSGLTRDDRIYKLLDEQALKMMMRCDELIDVSADIKEKRKEMIHNVQTVLAKLESKVPINPSNEHNSNQMETTLAVFTDPSSNTNESQKETLT